MMIYGTAALSLCLLAGMWTGRLLGRLAGMDIDIGGVGIAMVLLIFLTDWMRKMGLMKPPVEAGVQYWSAVYIPIVVAMAATQNVHAAIRGGPAAFLAGALAVAACFTLVPVISRIGGGAPSLPLDPPA